MTKDPLIFLVMVVGLYALIIATATTCDATQPRTVHHDVVVDTVRVYDTVRVSDTIYHIDGRTVFDIHKRWQQER